MRRLFEIEWPDDCGVDWMNEHNLMLCIREYCKEGADEVKVRDATPVEGHGVHSAPLGSGPAMENPHK